MSLKYLVPESKAILEGDATCQKDTGVSCKGLSQAKSEKNLITVDYNLLNKIKMDEFMVL